MSQLNIRGLVSLEGGDLPIAGVTVVAFMPATDIAKRGSSYDSNRMEIGRAVSGSDGAFAIETNDYDPLISRWACVLRNCSEFQFQLGCFDSDETLLHETEPLSYHEDFSIQIALPEPEFAASRKGWEEFTRLIMAAQTVRLGNIALELATLTPRGVFASWTVTRRLGTLGRLEQALLDAENKFAQAGVRIRFSRLENESELGTLREELNRIQRPDLARELATTIRHAQVFGGFREIAAFVNPEKFKVGDTIGGVNDFLNGGVSSEFSEIFPWLFSPAVGYRDYLRDRWCDNQRIEHVDFEPNAEVASLETMVKRLNNRFHQDFSTHNEKKQPANTLLIPILLKALLAPTGAGYGFGRAPVSIDPQGERTHREYLDHLISLTGITLKELEKRYRLNLRRSDLEQSNLVQQNIDTLQRFFTDSYQSVADPFAIAPDRKAGTPELLITKFPPEGAGPFFLEYEEWLEREAPFYPENHYDPRATYRWTTDEHPAQKTREAVFAHSVPLSEALLQSLDTVKFVPGKGAFNLSATKWQWVRNHLDLQDLINSAHDDAKSLNYVTAEAKYVLALEWARQLRELIHFAPAGWWEYNPAAIAKQQKNDDVRTMAGLEGYEQGFHLYLGWHYGITQEYGDLLTGNSDISDRWWGGRPDIFPLPGYKGKVAYLIDHLYFRLLPACLSEVQLALGKYADAVRQLVRREGVRTQTVQLFAGPAGFDIFAADQAAGGTMGIGGVFQHFTGGPLAYASSSDQTKYPTPDPPTSVPTNPAELGYFKLKLGNAALEWADVLYRSNQPESIMRARELYKAVIFLHGEDPDISPTWDPRDPYLPPHTWKISAGNPAIVSQVTRGRLGFLQINGGLNYYGVSPTFVPPVRYRVLKEASDRFAAGARGAQVDFLNYMQQLDQLTVSEMTARAMVNKATAAITIAQEQQKIAEFNVGEAQKQVDAINGQIAAKKAEIAKKDSFFEQAIDFAGGMKDSIGKLGEMAFAGESDPQAASAKGLSTGEILSLGFKVGTASNVLGGASSALAGGAGVAGPFGAFLYAGVTSISSLADAIAKRSGELANLQNVALPAAKALVDLKRRDVTIAQFSQAIAKADWQLGKDLLAFYAQRFLNRSFLVTMSEFSNRLMRRYLDLAGRTAWQAERALAFEQDSEFGIIAFDYFPRNLRGVSGADLLQLHLAELEAARIQGLTQTIPVKQTISLARDFPIQFGQLKKTGFCRFATGEQPLRLVYPGVYGYRVRNVTIAANYAAPIQPHRGLFSNQGVSLVSRDKPGSDHTLVRYPDALPLSEFRMRDDMWVFDLPDETLLPFEGSGIETIWELMLSRIGNANGFDSMTDMLITFDMRASYSALLETQHIAALPNTANRSLLVSAKAGNAAALTKFRKQGGKVTLAFDLAKLGSNASETQRKTLNYILVAVGVDDTPFTATFSSAKPAKSAVISFEKGIALSNAGALADGNGGVPLPLNAFVGLDVEQTLKLRLDAGANPGSKLKQLEEVLLLVEYEAKF